MNAMDRYQSEQSFHDRQASQRAVTFAREPGRLQVDVPAYIHHETWIQPALAQLGDPAGLRILDLGCGHGMAAVVLARSGALVTGIDISHGYLAEARARARASGVLVEFIQASGEYLPFEDGSFDRIWGNAVLHHLDLDLAARELYRVLRPGGRAVFCEPWGGNPLLTWVRRNLAYPGKDRTRHEQPLHRHDLRRLRSVFPRIEMTGHQLLSMACRLLPRGRLLIGLDWCDRQLLSRFPRLQRYCRYVVLTLWRE